MAASGVGSGQTGRGVGGCVWGEGAYGLHVRHQSFAQPYFAYLSHWSHGAHLLLAETAPPTRASSRCEAGYAALIPPSHGARCAEGEPNLRLQRGGGSETPSQKALVVVKQIFLPLVLQRGKTPDDPQAVDIDR